MKIDFDEYVEFTNSGNALYPEWDRRGSRQGIGYVVLGFCGEAGEVANKVKKWLRGDVYPGCVVEDSFNAMRGFVRDEIGDVMWYLARILWHLDISMDEVLEANMKKLEDRRARGVVQGNGDNR